MLVQGSLLYAEPVPANGLLFIGDPEVSSPRPGRRKDPDWPNAILRKLEHCVTVCAERELVPVILGDVFEYAFERDESVKTRLIQIFKSFWITPITNVGNHDMANTRLSVGDSLYMLAVSDVIDAVVEGGPVCTFDLGGKLLGMGATPYGQEIPTDVTGMFPGVERVLWLTHHDISLQETFPGAVRPFEIKGCRIAVNGHIHARKVPEQVGDTRWENPGTINRSTYDLLDHVPCAWALNPKGPLEAIPLPHDRDVFNLLGKLVAPATTKEVVESIETVFVSLLQAESTGEMEQSGDGSVLLEDIKAKMEAENTPEDIRAVLLDLHARAVEEERKAA